MLEILGEKYLSNETMFFKFEEEPMYKLKPYIKKLIYSMERVIGLWTLGRVCATVSAVKCVNLAIHRPVPLGLIIHYMLIKNKN